MRPSPSIVLVALFLPAVCLLVLVGSLVEFVSAIEIYRETSRPLIAIVNARLFAFLILPVSLSLLGIVASVGLFRLREWAWKLAVFLSIAPVTSCALLVLLHPAAIFPADNKYAILAVGDLGIVIYTYALIVLIPVSICWLVLFTRPSIRSQFR